MIYQVTTNGNVPNASKIRTWVYQVAILSVSIHVIPIELDMNLSRQRGGALNGKKTPALDYLQAVSSNSECKKQLKPLKNIAKCVKAMNTRLQNYFTRR